MWEPGPDGVLGLDFFKGGLCPSCFGSYWNEAGPCVLTVVGVSGPAEAPQSPVAQLEGGLVALAQGRAVPQREGGVLRTPVSNEAVLLAPGGGQGDRVTGPFASCHVMASSYHSRILQDQPQSPLLWLALLMLRVFCARLIFRGRHLLHLPAQHPRPFL